MPLLNIKDNFYDNALFNDLLVQDKLFVEHYLSQKDNPDIEQAYIIYHTSIHRQPIPLMFYKSHPYIGHQRSLAWRYIERLEATGKIHTLPPQEQQQLMYYKKQFSNYIYLQTK